MSDLTPSVEHSIRRAEAFAVLDVWESRVPPPHVAPVERRVLAALRSVLERHRPQQFGWCMYCTATRSPCPDETVVIDALLGEET